MSFVTSYQRFIDHVVEQTDPRVKEYFFVKYPSLVVLLLIIYVIVLLIGPSIMKNRKPYSLKTFIHYYNNFQVVANTYIVYECLNSGWLTTYTLGCEPLRLGTEPERLREARISYLVSLVKMIDLIETVVYILRKKNNQISVLHVYHHISTVLVTYSTVLFHPGGMVTMLMVINGSVHVIMYSYYQLASMGPKFQRLVRPIKPYITRIQIAQFLFLMAHQSQAFLPSCSVPLWLPTLMVGNLLVNLALFLNFYAKNYKKTA